MKPDQFRQYDHIERKHIRGDEFPIKSIPDHEEQSTAFEMVGYLIDYLDHLGLEVFVAVSYMHSVGNSI